MDEYAGFVRISDPPDPWAKLPELAARLGVPPLDPNGPPTVCIQTKAGERYDLFALIHAFLDRLDGPTP